MVAGEEAAADELNRTGVTRELEAEVNERKAART